MAAEPMTDEQVEEMRRAWDGYVRQRHQPLYPGTRDEVASRHLAYARSRIQIEKRAIANMPSILASLDHRETTLRRMSKAPAGPAPAAGENIRPKGGE